MDAFDTLMAKARRRQRRKNMTLWICIPLIVLLAVSSILFYINHLAVEVRMNGPREITLEYGQSYAEPGAEAVFMGRFFPREEKSLEVTTEGTVDDQTVGTYKITYSASEKLWSDTQVRTVHVIDSVEPVIELTSIPGTYTVPGHRYEEEGFVARDNYDGDITDRVRRREADGIVTYYVEDSSGNSAEVKREIFYDDPIPPVLMMLGAGDMTVYAGEPFADPGYTAIDNSVGDITDQVQISGEVDVYRIGTYELHYQVSDSFGNSASATRTVRVKPKSQPATVVPEGKVIYLTFDDGPSAYTKELLEILKKHDVKATFFVCDTDYIDVLKDIAADGHAIGIHSVTHAYKSIYASEDAYFADLYKMQGIIEEKTGIKTTLVRFPGGSSNTVSSFNEGIMTRLARHLTEQGFQYFDWNVDSDDAGRTRTEEKVLKNVTEGVQKRSVSIVLQHDVKQYSVAAVEEIILWGKENGYRFLPLDPTSPTAHHEINN